MEWIISISALIAVILAGIRKRNKRAKKDFSYTQFMLDRDDDRKKHQQEIDDRQLLRDAKAEAYDMFMQWLDGNSIIIRKPIIKFILQHYPYQSKYTSEDLEVIRKTEFNRLKKEYEEKYGTISNGGLFDPRKWQGRIPGTNTGIPGQNSGLQTTQTDLIS